MPALAIAGGAAAGAAFADRQRRWRTRCSTCGCSGSPASAAALGSNVVSFFTGFGVLLFTSQYLQLVLGVVATGRGPVDAAVLGRVHRGLVLTPVLTRRAPPVAR